MNKAELIEALAVRLGDRKTATAALDAVLAEVQAAVTKGERVAITGFGVFEKRVRGPRTARNPRTGETVKVKKTSVPTFRPGAGFKEMVASGRVPKTAAAKKTAAKATATKAATAKKAATKAPATKAATKKAAPTKAAKATKATTRTAAAKGTSAKATTAKKSAAKTTRSAATKSAATKRSPARKAPAKKTAPRR